MAPRNPVAAVARVAERLRGRGSRRDQLRALRGTRQEDLVTALRGEVAPLGDQGTQGVLSPWWRTVRTELVELIEHDDPRTFLNWGPIRQTMFLSGREEFVAAELDALRADPAWEQRWSHALRESPAGCPPPYTGLTSSSATLIHHAYHVATLEREIGRPVESLREIVEFGGGYGSFARLVYGLGFCGSYYVYDFPELNALQRYYIGSVAAANGDGAFAAGLTAASNPAVFPRTGLDSLFIALWSLSETPVSEREPWVERIAAAQHVLFAFQEDFEDVDNNAWFDALQEHLDSHDWSSWSIPHLPGHSYLVGSRWAPGEQHTSTRLASAP